MKRLSYELGEQYIGGDSSEQESASKGVSEEDRRELGKALCRLMEEGLTRKQKQYVMLYYWEGLTVVQIADKMDVSPSTVSRTLTRARKRLAGEVRREALRKLIGGK